jgi:hypothetical protein
VSWLSHANVTLPVGRGAPVVGRCDIQQLWRRTVADCCLLRTLWLEGFIKVLWLHFISGEEGGCFGTRLSWCYSVSSGPASPARRISVQKVRDSTWIVHGPAAS